MLNDCCGDIKNFPVRNGAFDLSVFKGICGVIFVNNNNEI